jgi:hypothetical protein
VRSFYQSYEWDRLRYRTLRAFGFKCMACGARKTELHVDHIKPVSRFPRLALDPSNLQVLCRSCNMGKSNRYCDDLRDVDAPKDKAESLKIKGTLAEAVLNSESEEKQAALMKAMREVQGAMDRGDIPRALEIGARALVDDRFGEESA